jgi:hypothetical protein
MRTYYFDTKDGAIVRDTVGLQFLTTAAAIEHGKHLAQHFAAIHVSAILTSTLE